MGLTVLIGASWPASRLLLATATRAYATPDGRSDPKLTHALTCERHKSGNRLSTSRFSLTPGKRDRPVTKERTRLEMKRDFSRIAKVVGLGALAALALLAGSAPAQAAPRYDDYSYGREVYGYGRYDGGYSFEDRSWRSDGWDRGMRLSRSSRYRSADPRSRWGDWDRDGIPNCHDRDIDGDGIPNERDRYNWSRGSFGGRYERDYHRGFDRHDRDDDDYRYDRDRRY